VECEWDDGKAQANLDKHGVSFTEAVTAFADDAALLIDDPEHSDEEERGTLIGTSSSGRMVVVCYTVRAEAVRIISAREASPAERRQYAN